MNPDACFFCGTAISDGVLCTACTETPEQSSRDYIAAVRRSAITEAVDRLTDEGAMALLAEVRRIAPYPDIAPGTVRAALRRALTEGT
jgi:hypothetical protein